MTPLPSTDPRRTAIVIGGSIGGLLAARVLASHYERVVVVERDVYPLEPAFRAGTPQVRHAHVLLSGGARLFEELFPGLQADLAAAGAPEIDWTSEEVPWLSAAGWMARFPSGGDFVSRSCSRELLEWAVRRRLAADRRILFFSGYEATRLLADGDGERVTGVRVRNRDVSRGPLEWSLHLHAGLVVDASGRDSAAPSWLETLGHGRPQETVVTPQTGYASRCYRLPRDLASRFRALVVQLAPPAHTRGAYILPWEGDRWIVTLTGGAGDYPPTDEAGFLEFARGLRTPCVHEALRHAEPLSPIQGWRRTENRLRRYDGLPTWPAGFIVLGDAVCTFNPVYGQGMTVAALGARLLGDVLRASGPDRSDRWARTFQKRLGRTIADAWMLATSEDHRWQTTTGARPGRLSALVQRYVDAVVALSTEDTATCRAFCDVLTMRRPARTLFAPRIAARLARRALARRWLPDIARRASPRVVRVTSGAGTPARASA